MACIGVFLALAFSNYFLLQRSGHIANTVRYQQERKLVKHELENQLMQFAHAQSQISDWDDSYDAFKGVIDEQFVSDNITNWLWVDFGILMTYVVTIENKTKIAVYKDKLLPPGSGENIIQDNLDLIKQARAKYLMEFSSDRPIPAAKLIKDILAKPRDGRFAWSVRTINGQLVCIIAQVVAPDRGVALKDFRPDILFTVRPIDKEYLVAASQKLMVKDLHFDYLNEVHEENGYMPIVPLPDGRIVHARWTSDQPSQTIWRQTLPVLAIPFILVAVALTLIAWRFSKMLHALQISEQQNRFLAMHDALTGLPNRLHFDLKLEQLIAQQKDAQCSIICLDLDRFKSVNDNFGHSAGDTVLSIVSQRISKRLGRAGLVARVGGDEFNILLFGKLDDEALQSLCDDLIAEVCVPIPMPDGIAEVGASIGVAKWPDDALTVKSVLRCADEALYASKINGRRRVSFAKSRARRSTDLASSAAQTQQLDESVDKLKGILARAS